MADIPNYKEIALSYIQRGFKVLALEGKSPQNTHSTAGRKRLPHTRPWSRSGVSQRHGGRRVLRNGRVLGVGRERCAVVHGAAPVSCADFPCDYRLKSGEEWQDSPLWMTRERHYHFKSPVPVSIKAKFPNPRKDEASQPDNLMEARLSLASGSPHKSGVLYEAVNKFPCSLPLLSSCRGFARCL